MTLVAITIFALGLGVFLGWIIPPPEWVKKRLQNAP